MKKSELDVGDKVKLRQGNTAMVWANKKGEKYLSINDSLNVLWFDVYDTDMKSKDNNPLDVVEKL